MELLASTGYTRIEKLVELRLKWLKSHDVRTRHSVKDIEALYMLLVGRPLPGVLVGVDIFHGAILHLLSHFVAAAGKIIGVDSFSDKSADRLAGANTVMDSLKTKGYDAALVKGNSRKVKPVVRSKLKGNKIDMLHIGEGYDYESVRDNYDVYSPLVQSGGIIFIHNIARAGNEHSRFWNEMKMELGVSAVTLKQPDGSGVNIGAVLVE